MDLVRKHFSIANSEFKHTPELAQQCLKAFNQFGYKTLSVMVFGDAATSLNKLDVGSIIAILNPKILKSSNQSNSKDGALTYCIESDAAIITIGYS